MTIWLIIGVALIAHAIVIGVMVIVGGMTK